MVDDPAAGMADALSKNHSDACQLTVEAVAKNNDAISNELVCGKDRKRERSKDERVLGQGLPARAFAHLDVPAQQEIVPAIRVRAHV